MPCQGDPAEEYSRHSVGAKTASAVYLAGFEVPDTNPISQADNDEFIRTHKRTRYRFGPDGSLRPIEE